MRWTLRQRGPQQFWRQYRVLYGQEFRDHVDGLICEGEAAE
jgi:hypothetical protein